jgi:hypothetical protein
MAEKIFTREKGSNQEGDYEINGSRIYKRNSSSRLASESCSSTEKEHKRMVHVRPLHGPQQTLPKDPFGLPRIDQIVD